MCATGVALQGSADIAPFQNVLARLLFEPTVRASRISRTEYRASAMDERTSARAHAHASVGARRRDGFAPDDTCDDLTRCVHGRRDRLTRRPQAQEML